MKYISKILILSLFFSTPVAIFAEEEKNNDQNTLIIKKVIQRYQELMPCKQDPYKRMKDVLLSKNYEIVRIIINRQVIYKVEHLLYRNFFGLPANKKGLARLISIQYEEAGKKSGKNMSWFKADSCTMCEYNKYTNKFTCIASISEEQEKEFINQINQEPRS